MDYRQKMHTERTALCVHSAVGTCQSIGENEIRIIGSNAEEQPRVPERKKGWLAWLIAGLLVAGAILWLVWGGGSEATTAVEAPADGISAQEGQTPLTSYVLISDTIINNVSLHRPWRHYQPLEVEIRFLRFAERHSSNLALKMACELADGVDKMKENALFR